MGKKKPKLPYWGDRTHPNYQKIKMFTNEKIIEADEIVSRYGLGGCKMWGQFRITGSKAKYYYYYLLFIILYEYSIDKIDKEEAKSALSKLFISIKKIMDHQDQAMADSKEYQRMKEMIKFLSFLGGGSNKNIEDPQALEELVESILSIVKGFF